MKRSEHSTITGRVTQVRWRGTTKSGNPRWSIHLEGEKEFDLADDVQLSCVIDNAEYRQHSHEFLLNANGRIVSAVGQV